jgi:hypothetical protein
MQIRNKLALGRRPEPDAKNLNRIEKRKPEPVI